MIKTLLLALTLGFSTLASAEVTSKHILACVQHPMVELVGTTEQYRNAGFTKQKLLESLPKDIDKELLVAIKQALDFVFDKSHEVSPSISIMVQCLNAQVRGSSTIL